MRRRGTAVLTTGFMIALLAGCTSGEPGGTAGSASDSVHSRTILPSSPAPSRSPSTVTRSPDTSAASTSAPVPAVLDFSGELVDGSAFDGASLAGAPVVVWFWAPWCPVCKSQIPQVQAAAAEYAGRAAVIGIGSLDDSSAIVGFAAEAPGVTMLQDPEGDLWRHFGITEQSTFVVLDADGNEVRRTSYGEDVDLAATLAGLTG